MLKKQVAEILLDVALHFEKGDEEQLHSGTSQIHNLYKARFKEVVDKLTVVDDGELALINKRWYGDCGANLSILQETSQSQLQDIKKQLLDLTGE